MEMIKIDSESIQEILIQAEKGNLIHSEHYVYNFEHNEVLEILFKNLHINNTFHFNENAEYSIPIRFESCRFEEGVSFESGNIKKYLYFHSVVFIKGISLNGTQFNSLEFDSKCNFRQRIQFNDGIFKYVELKSPNTEAIFIRGGTFEQIVITDKFNGLISIRDQSLFIDTLVLSLDSSKLSLTIKNIVLNTLVLSGEFGENSSIQISGILLHQLNIIDLDNLGVLELFDINVHKRSMKSSGLNYNSWHRYKSNILKPLKGDYDLETIEKRHIGNHSEILRKRAKKPYNQVIIDKDDNSNSNLSLFRIKSFGNCTFDSFDLTTFDVIKIHKSNFSKIKLINSVFPFKNIKGEPHQLYDVFNSLYLAAERANNKRDKLHYLAASKETLLKNKKIDISTKIALLIPKFYSDLGRSWLRAVIITVILGFLFFSLMIGTSYYSLDLSNSGISKWLSMLPFFIQFLNPIHNIGFMDYKFDNILFSGNLLFNLWDSIGRIAIGIGIYEVIRSFRRLSN